MPKHKNADLGVAKTTICLNMIVRNEAHIIQRCLESVIPHIDYWVIADTGSTDGTQQLIQEVLQDVPGELIEREWQNFGHNRNEALEHAIGKADYILIIDADEWLEAGKHFDFSDLNSDSYYITKKQRDKQYWVRNIVRNDMGWRWHGVIHEYLECETAETYDELHDAVIQARQEGARANDPATYRKDAALLTQALIDEPDNTRYQFYLAQSWRDADEYELAIVNYKRRIEMGGWEEEIFYAKYQIAFCMQLLGQDWDVCQKMYLDAWAHTPERAEPLYQIGLHYLEDENWPMAWLFMNQAARLKKPDHLLLFIQDSVYTYEALLDAAVAAGHLGYMHCVKDLHEELFSRNDVPENIIKRARQNQKFFEEVAMKNDNCAA